MAELSDFNFDDLPDTPSFDPLPAGRYSVEIVESDLTHKDEEWGPRVSVTYVVTSGEYEGRKGWDKFDLRRIAQTKSGPQAIDAGRYKELLVALGMNVNPPDTNDLHGIGFTASATIRPANGQYSEGNNWRGFRQSIDRPVAAAPTRQAAPATAAKPATNGKSVPWKKTA